MTPTAGTPTPRVVSLDVFRGAAIAGMLLVNNPGSWSHIYDPLEHAAWNGWTPTDLIFPFFLFIVGVAMVYSFAKRASRGASRGELMTHVARRALALTLLGWWGASWSPILWPGPEGLGGSSAGAAEAAGGAVEVLGATGASGGTVIAALLLRVGYPLAMLSAVVLLAGTKRAKAWGWALAIGVALFVGSAVALGFTDPLLSRIAGIRIPGVLVRIGVCYLIASAIYLFMPSRRALVTWIVGILVAYAVWMTLVPVPGFGMPDVDRGFPTAATTAGELFSNWAFWIDYHLLGEHTWSVRQLWRDGVLVWSFDPEGVASTLPAVCTVLLGILTGFWMRRDDRTQTEILSGMLVAGCWLCLAGVLWSVWMPINKRLWTSSYTVFTSGMALLCLGVAYHAVDMKGYRTLFEPLRVYGMNAIFAFVASGMMAVALGNVTVSVAGEPDAAGAAAGTTEVSLKAWIYDALLQLPGDERVASFLFALGFVAVWGRITWWMDRRGIYFKI